MTTIDEFILCYQTESINPFLASIKEIFTYGRKIQFSMAYLFASDAIVKEKDQHNISKKAK